MKNIFKLLNFNIDKTEEEKRTFKVGILSTLLLEAGIVATLIRNDEHDSIKFIFLSIIIAIICILMLISIKLYEIYIFLSADYIIYTVRTGDNLITISEQFLPECNPFRTANIIKIKNNIDKTLHPGEQILIPIKHKFKI